MKIEALLAICLLVSAESAEAQFKCKKPDGSIGFQDRPCPNDTTSERVRITSTNTLGPAAERPDHIRRAIAEGKPAVGMTLAELERAIGKPEKVNAAQYGKDFKNQLIYYTESRTLYVYTTDGIVTAIQNSEGGRPVQPVPISPSRTSGKRCPTASDIRSIEIELSKISNQDKQHVLVELHRQLGEARTCKSE